ncbi:MAG: enoyl-CoA hydratase/isomerase family protein [Sphingomonadaceae bacterium]
MMQVPPLLVEREGSVVTLTLNRPESGNALNQEMVEALLREALRCDNDDSVRCVVLTGAGRTFCSGGDIGNFRTAGASIAEMVSEGASMLHVTLSKLIRMNKPLVVLVNGPAGGAGFSLALIGDIVIASHSAYFTAGYSAIGMTPDGGLTWMLPKLVGLRRAQEMILTNRKVGAEEAAAIGLITRVVSEDVFAEEGAKTAAVMADAATGALAAARSLLLQGFGNGLETQFELEARAIAHASASAEAREGIAAFAERRKPVFDTVAR